MKLGMILTGGGTDVIPSLLRNGGASSYFSFADVPYSQESTIAILKRVPEKFGSLNTANSLAVAAINKLESLHGHGEGLVGIGCSAVLAKKDQRDDRENVAWIAKYESLSVDNDKVLEIGIKFLIPYREDQEKILANTIQAVVTKELNFSTKLSFRGYKEPSYHPRYAKLIYMDSYII